MSEAHFYSSLSILLGQNGMVYPLFARHIYIFLLGNGITMYKWYLCWTHFLLPRPLSFFINIKAAVLIGAGMGEKNPLDCRTVPSKSVLKKTKETKKKKN